MVRAQPYPICERCRSAWMRGDRNEQRKKRASGDKPLHGALLYQTMLMTPKRTWTSQGQKLNQIQVKKTKPDSVQLQCLRCWPTGSTTGGLQHADNRSDGASGEFWYDHKTLVYQFAWFSTTHTCTPHSHYACLSESYWKGNHFPCTSLATISMSSIHLLILLLPCAATYC